VNTVAAGVFGATIGGGGFRGTSGNFTNSVSGVGGTVSGGSSNTAGSGAIVGGGNANTANGVYSVVSGGQLNSATGGAAMVPGGQVNKAGGFASMAAGSYAHVRSAAETGGAADDGTFVWSDSTGTNSNQFTSNGVNQFLIRAGGGVGINTIPYNPEAELTIQGSATGASSNADIILLPRSSPYGFDLSVSGTAQGDAVFAIDTTANNFAKIFGLDASGNLSIAGATASKPGGGSWSVPSDARLKRDIQPLENILDKLLQLRGVTYEYRSPDGLHPPGRHTGFIAQQVQPIFPEWVGRTADGYLSVGPTGFEAMTVEALRELRAEQDGEIAQLQAENAQLHERLDDIAARLDRLEARP
ncbi:MAG TPA: tail fiber domain-containing protein, partial [Rudaea sp.]|nr:tail fiber domain-containing protein [Rudaea sp.]